MQKSYMLKCVFNINFLIVKLVTDFENIFFLLFLEYTIYLITKIGNNGYGSYCAYINDYIFEGYN